LCGKNTIIYEFFIDVKHPYLNEIFTYNNRLFEYMQQLMSIMAFYRSFILWSFSINIIITIVNPNIFAAIITKLLLTIFLWYVVNETSEKRKLVFYKNLGISTFKLFSVLFFVDILITITFLILIKEII